MTDDVRCRSAASELVIPIYAQRDAAAAKASGAQLAIPVAIDPGRPDETARPDYHAYGGGCGRCAVDDGWEGDVKAGRTRTAASDAAAADLLATMLRGRNQSATTTTTKSGRRRLAGAGLSRRRRQSTARPTDIDAVNSGSTWTTVLQIPADTAAARSSLSHACIIP